MTSPVAEEHVVGSECVKSRCTEEPSVPAQQTAQRPAIPSLVRVGGIILIMSCIETCNTFPCPSR